MATTKEMFLSDTALRDWWASIANDPKFDRVLLHAQGSALETMPSSEQRAGLMAMKEILLTLHEPEPDSIKYAKPGLDHNLDFRRRNVDDPEPNKK